MWRNANGRSLISFDMCDFRFNIKTADEQSMQVALNFRIEMCIAMSHFYVACLQKKERTSVVWHCARRGWTKRLQSSLWCTCAMKSNLIYFMIQFNLLFKNTFILYKRMSSSLYWLKDLFLNLTTIKTTPAMPITTATDAQWKNGNKKRAHAIILVKHFTTRLNA